ncbi:MAG TPA: TlpA disulfide reductase family protein [Caulobacteraceae bacterium]|nr:TlpA disulfide reductase family protein [Caulobacteraceae bacterium]
MSIRLTLARPMSKSILPALLALACGVCAPALLGAAHAQPGAGAAPSAVITRFKGRPAPSLSGASDRSGAPIDLPALRGKVVIVNMWATWCAPCRIEMPSLERLAAAHPRDLVVIAVSNDQQGWPAVNGFWGPKFAHVRLALASGPDLSRRLGVLGLPYSLVIDQNGDEVARVPRAGEWDAGALRSLVDAAIAFPPAATAAHRGA